MNMGIPTSLSIDLRPPASPALREAAPERPHPKREAFEEHLIAESQASAPPQTEPEPKDMAEPATPAPEPQTDPQSPQDSSAQSPQSAPADVPPIPGAEQPVDWEQGLIDAIKPIAETALVTPITPTPFGVELPIVPQIKTGPSSPLLPIPELSTEPMPKPATAQDAQTAPPIAIEEPPDAIEELNGLFQKRTQDRTIVKVTDHSPHEMVNLTPPDKGAIPPPPALDLPLPAPPPSGTTLIPPLELIDQVKINLLEGVKAGEKRISVHLQPPELGRLNIELSLKDKQIEARIVTEHPVVREVMLSNLEQLRSQLAHEGLTLGKVDVSVGTFREQPEQRAQEGSLGLRGRFYRGGVTNEATAPMGSEREWRPPGIGGRINMIV